MPEPDPDLLLERARRMRRQPTPAERVMWRALRAARLDGFKFKRQEVMGVTIVDFVCHSERVIVEFDGDSHVGKEAYDSARKSWLHSQGYTVLRFGTEIVRYSDVEILGVIWEACHGQQPE